MLLNNDSILEGIDLLYTNERSNNEGDSLTKNWIVFSFRDFKVISYFWAASLTFGQYDIFRHSY